MTNTGYSNLIADAVLEEFSQGLRIDSDTEHFLLSYEGLKDKSSIPGFLKNSSSYLSPVYQILIHPGHGIRLKVEKIIPAVGLCKDKIKEVERIITDRAPVIFIDAYGEKIPLPFSEFGTDVLRYINRLNLEVNAGIFPEDENGFLEERVFLRSMNYSPEKEAARFLAVLAAGSRKINSGEYNDIFEFAVRMTGTENENILQVLEKKKHFYESCIDDAAEFGRLIGRYSMEFIMSKRVAPPLVSIEEARETLTKIDLITDIAYGIIIPSMDHGVSLSIDTRDLYQTSGKGIF